jgi:hypothetical protein
MSKPHAWDGGRMGKGYVRAWPYLPVLLYANAEIGYEEGVCGEGVKCARGAELTPSISAICSSAIYRTHIAAS